MNMWLSTAEQAEIWDRYEAGQYIQPIARAIGRSSKAVRALITKTGGVRPLVPNEWSDARLSLVDRRRSTGALPAGSPPGASPYASAGPRRRSRGRSAPMGAASATGPAKRTRWHASAPDVRNAPSWRQVRDCAGWWRRSSKSAGHRRQIADWLPREYPLDPEMRVSHETIYMSLFVQGRGALRHELFRCLRQGRALRCPKGARLPSGKGIIDMVMISERPAEVEDRAVPGHWEGDLERHEAP